MQRFDLIVIGTGSGNSIVDEHFADRSVALLDDGARFGGTCLNYGCIPTKMFVVPADLARTPAQAKRLGVKLQRPAVDWPAIRNRIFGRIDPISDGGERWRAQAPNVTLYRQTARFTGERTLRVGDEEISADQVVIAAGSRARLLEVPGLDDPAVAARVHTSDTIMRIDELPESLVIIGAGYVAAEFAHVFAAFGVRVTVLARSGRLLRREDREISDRYTHLAARYADLRLRQVPTAVEADGDRVRVRTRDADGGAHTVTADLVLVAAGRVPNSDRLAVAAGGVEVDEAGFVLVDDQQRTTASGVWALGDVSSPWMLKHVANHEARVVRHNLLNPDDLISSDHRFVPHAVFGHPQVASIGHTEVEARALGLDVVTAVQEYGSVAYGWALEDESHCCKLVGDRSTGRLLGAHIIGPQASTLLQPIVQAMVTGMDALTMARGQFWIHPALTEVVENALLALVAAEPEPAT